VISIVSRFRVGHWHDWNTTGLNYVRVGRRKFRSEKVISRFEDLLRIHLYHLVSSSPRYATRERAPGGGEGIDLLESELVLMIYCG
jgi:hypothetical protein